MIQGEYKGGRSPANVVAPPLVRSTADFTTHSCAIDRGLRPIDVLEHKLGMPTVISRSM